MVNAKDDPGKRCFFHSQGLHSDAKASGCKAGDKCKFSHDKIPYKEFQKWKKPGLTAPGTPKGKGDNDKGKGKGKKSWSGKGTPKGTGKGSVPHCHQWLKDKKCDFHAANGYCSYPHLDQGEYDAAQKKFLEKIKKDAAAKGKGKKGD